METECNLCLGYLLVSSVRLENGWSTNYWSSHIHPNLHVSLKRIITWSNPPLSSAVPSTSSSSFPNCHHHSSSLPLSPPHSRAPSQRNGHTNNNNSSNGVVSAGRLWVCGQGAFGFRGVWKVLPRSSCVDSISISIAYLFIISPITWSNFRSRSSNSSMSPCRFLFHGGYK